MRIVDHVPLSNEIIAAAIADFSRASVLRPLNSLPYHDRALAFLASFLAGLGDRSALAKVFCDFDRTLALDPRQGDVYYYRALVHEVILHNPASAATDIRFALAAHGCPEPAVQLRRRLWWLGRSLRSTTIFRARIAFRVLTYVCVCNTWFLVLTLTGSKQLQCPGNMISEIVVMSAFSLLAFYIFAWMRNMKTLRGHGFLDLGLGLLVSTLWGLSLPFPGRS